MHPPKKTAGDFHARWRKNYMKQRTIVITAGIFLGLILVFAVVSHSSSKWETTRPTKENFDKAVRIIWEKDIGARNYNAFADPANPLCISVPLYPAPDARSRAQQPLAGHLDFILGTTQTEDRKHQLRQLDALCKVGLMEKSYITANLNNKNVPVTRYKLTVKGWAASVYSGDPSNCFVYGSPSYLGISRYEQIKFNEQTGFELYEVHAKSGLGSDADLAPWARDQELKTAFPDIAENLKGQEFTVLLVRSENGWVDYQTMVQDEARKKAPKSADHANSERPPMPDKMKRRIDELNSLPPPTIDEVKKRLQMAHGVDHKDPWRPWPTPCIDLPGSEKLPVDKQLFTYDPPHYSVAIFSNKERTEYDRVANKTIPYLNMLERLGILKKHAKSRILGEGKESKTLFDAYLYELSPSYESRIDTTDPVCFPLGEPSVEFVDIRIAEKDVNGYPNSSFRYKLKVMYKNPPAWMTDPSLMSEWSELRGVLEHGMACEGEFGFDRKTRDMYSGAGSCWWAFDSYYENY
jgi:hypothetical protein